MGRRPCCEKVGLKKGRWTTVEDERLRNYIVANGEGSWRSLPKNAGLLRCGKSCRLRWINYLRSDLKRGNITSEEEDVIIKLHASLGNRWSLIASHLPGRTDNQIKNYWNSHLSHQIQTFPRRNDDVAVIVDKAKLSLPPARKGGSGRRSKAEVEAEVAREIPSLPMLELERESTVCGNVDDPTEERESPNEETINKPAEERHDVGDSVTLNFNDDVFEEEDMSLDFNELLTNVEMELNGDYDDDIDKCNAAGTCESHTTTAPVVDAVSDAGEAEVELGGGCSSISSSFSLDSPWNWESFACGLEWDAAEFDAGEDLSAAVAEPEAVISWLLS